MADLNDKIEIIDDLYPERELSPEGQARVKQWYDGTIKLPEHREDAVKMITDMVMSEKEYELARSSRSRHSGFIMEPMKRAMDAHGKEVVMTLPRDGMSNYAAPPDISRILPNQPPDTSLWPERWTAAQVEEMRAKYAPTSDFRRQVLGGWDAPLLVEMMQRFDTLADRPVRPTPSQLEELLRSDTHRIAYTWDASREVYRLCLYTPVTDSEAIRIEGWGEATQAFFKASVHQDEVEAIAMVLYSRLCCHLHPQERDSVELRLWLMRVVMDSARWQHREDVPSHHGLVGVGDGTVITVDSGYRITIDDDLHSQGRVAKLWRIVGPRVMLFCHAAIPDVEIVDSCSMNLGSASDLVARKLARIILPLGGHRTPEALVSALREICIISYREHRQTSVLEAQMLRGPNKGTVARNVDVGKSTAFSPQHHVHVGAMLEPHRIVAHVYHLAGSRRISATEMEQTIQFDAFASVTPDLIGNSGVMFTVADFARRVAYLLVKQLGALGPRVGPQVELVIARGVELQIAGRAAALSLRNDAQYDVMKLVEYFMVSADCLGSGPDVATLARAAQAAASEMSKTPHPIVRVEMSKSVVPKNVTPAFDCATWLGPDRVSRLGPWADLLRSRPIHDAGEFILDWIAESADQPAHFNVCYRGNRGVCLVVDPDDVVDAAMVQYGRPERCVGTAWRDPRYVDVVVSSFFARPAGSGTEQVYRPRTWFWNPES